MKMTPAQYTALKTDVLADGTLAPLFQASNPDGMATIAAAYNAPAVPDFWVWRTRVTKGEYVGSTSVDGTTFAWTGTGFITRSAGEQAAWAQLFDDGGAVNPSLANVRQAFADIFSGATAPAPANRTHLTTISRRKATRAEKLFATGTGSTAAPATMAFEGEIGASDVLTARNS